MIPSCAGLQAYSSCAVLLNISTTGGPSAASMFELLFIVKKILEHLSFDIVGEGCRPYVVLTNKYVLNNLVIF